MADHTVPPLPTPAAAGTDPGTATPQDTLDAALTPGGLALDRTALIGVIDRPAGPVALVRRIDGAVLRVEPGDRLLAGRVIDITLQHLVIAFARRDDMVLTLGA